METTLALLLLPFPLVGSRVCAARSPELAKALKEDLTKQRAALVLCRDNLQKALDNDQADVLGFSRGVTWMTWQVDELEKLADIAKQQLLQYKEAKSSL